MRISLDTDVPVMHHVLAVRSEAEARARCFGKKLNRGTEAAEAALALVSRPARRERPEMGLRRDGRVADVQFLYQIDAHPPAKIDEARESFWKQHDVPQNVRDFRRAAGARRGGEDAGSRCEVEDAGRQLGLRAAGGGRPEYFNGWRFTRCSFVRKFRRSSSIESTGD